MVPPTIKFLGKLKDWLKDPKPKRKYVFAKKCIKRWYGIKF